MSEPTQPRCPNWCTDRTHERFAGGVGIRVHSSTGRTVVPAVPLRGKGVQTCIIAAEVGAEMMAVVEPPLILLDSRAELTSAEAREVAAALYRLADQLEAIGGA